MTDGCPPPDDPRLLDWWRGELPTAEGEAFEAECAAYLGVNHAIGLGSGSDAIKLVLYALGVGPETEVVTPAFSFVASATAALQLGARPVFVDVDPATFALDPDRVSAAITPRVKRGHAVSG